MSRRQESQEDLRTLARGGVLGLGPVDAEVLFEAITVLTVLGTLTQLGTDTGLVRALRAGSR
jgi:hypothetical protein